MRVLVTGAAGFINGYLIPELLDAGHEVIGVDDLSKYGPTKRSFDMHPSYSFVPADAKDVDKMRELTADCDQVVAAAAMVGGITSYHQFAYDLLAENTRILSATFDAALDASLDGHLERIIVISSSMVYESATVFPTPEGAELASPPPVSTFGFQKLASEYFARGAWEQYRLPYTIIRPFNAIGVGDRRAVRPSEAEAGNIKLASGQVVPDMILKVLQGQDPLHVLGDGNQIRHYTYAGDIARGIRLAMESKAAVNNDFNIASPNGCTVLELAQKIWHRINGGKPFRVVSDTSYEYDVPMRVPDVRKAKQVLGFEARTTLDDVLDEMIPWLQQEHLVGRV